MPESRPSSSRPAAWWGVVGVIVLFLSATVRLGARGVEAIRSGLAPGEWVALTVLTVAFVYGEGYRALQRRWAPFVVERSARLGPDSPVAWRVLAPLYAMGLVGSDGRTRTKAWLGTGAIVVAVLVVRAFPDPWRGITDFAVAAALVWGAGGVALAARRRL